MHLLVSSSQTSPLTYPFHSPLFPLSFCPYTRLSPPLPPTITPPFSLPLPLSSPPSPSLCLSAALPLSPPSPLSISFSLFFQPCTSLSLLSSSAALKFVFLLLYCCFFHGFSIRISFSTGFSNFFLPVRAACALPLCSRLTHHYGADSSHNAAFSPPPVSAPAHQMMDKYFSNTLCPHPHLGLSFFHLGINSNNMNLHPSHFSATTPSMSLSLSAHPSLVLCISDTLYPHYIMVKGET